MVLFMLVLFMFLIGGATMLFCTALVMLSPVISVAVTILAVLNTIILIGLFIFRHYWKQAGKLDKTYINSFEGWKRGLLLTVKYALLLLIIWEVLFTLSCVVFLFVQPLQSMIPYIFG